MKNAILLVLMGTLLMIPGCTNRTQQAAQQSTPGDVQAPAAPTAPSTSPHPAADTASQSGLLTPHPSAGQRVDEGYLFSSDQNVAVGVQLITGTGDILMMKLAIANRAATPVVFSVKDVKMSAVGWDAQFLPRAAIASTYIPNATDFRNALLNNYWDDTSVLAPNSQEEHVLLAVCGKRCPMPVTVHVGVEGQTYDFVFGDASNTEVSGSASAEVLLLAPPEPSTQSAARAIHGLKLTDPLDRCRQPDAKAIGSTSYFVYWISSINADVELKFRGSYLGDEQHFITAVARRRGSNYAWTLGPDELARVMPCLLKSKGTP